MMNVLLLLVALQITAVLMKKTLIGRILITTYRIFKGLLKLDYDLLKKFSKFINKKQKLYRKNHVTKQPVKKVVGAEDIDLSKYDNVIDFTKYNKKGV